MIDLETLIGNVEMKTKSVHFFVKEIPTNFTVGIIQYVNEVVNVGGAMNSTTGQFTAPVPGIYHFDFSAMRGSSKCSTCFLEIQLQKNWQTFASKRLDSLPNKVVAISASLQLKRNDTVAMYVSGHPLYDSWQGITNFVGWLVEEDLKFLA